MSTSQCEYCAYYTYDETEDYYYCDMDMDEDEMERFMQNRQEGCPYYRNGDEYEMVKHQM
jgi:hypothetical protein